MSLDPLRVLPPSLRPGSSLSHRSVSRASQRPVSRLSQLSRQPRLVALLSTLVKQVTGFTEEKNGENIQEAVDLASKRIDQLKQAVVPDLSQVETSYRGRVKRARINMQDTLAGLMYTKYNELLLNVSQQNGLDEGIKLTTLPHHLQFLLLLSSPPTAATFSQAEIIFERDNQPAPNSPLLTWKKILQEEPFEGQHWQGAYGLPEGSTVENWDEESSGSDIFSFLQDPISPEDVALSSDDEPFQPQGNVVSQEQRPRISSKYRGRELVEALQAKQYWRSDWHTDADLRRPFDIGDVSTMGPALSRILMQNAASFAGPEHEIYINEIDAVRDVLIALQGRRSCLFRVGSGQDPHAVTVLHHRRIVHLTPASQASILAVFASFVTTLNPLRDFVSWTKEGRTFLSSTTAHCRTFEAFSAAIDRQLLLFDEWCAGQEERICLSQHGESSFTHVVSLLSLERDVGVRLSRTFHILLSIVRSIATRWDKSNPSTLSAMVLNSLLEAVRSRSAIGDTITARCLLSVWQESTEPLWANVGWWLKDGIPIRVGFEGETYATEPRWGEEFFIRTNPLVDLGSPDFWEGGYTLRSFHHRPVPGRSGEDSMEESGVPKFLQHIAEDLLAGGKAIGLLRALNMSHLLGEDWLKGWSDFGTLTETLSPHGLEELLENLVSETLLSSCRQAQFWFRQVLVDQCGLWKHVQSLEQVYLMTRGDAMSQFGEQLFTRMDARQPWHDFHFLNSAFQDVTKYGQTSWINPVLVRISHRGPKDRNINRTVRAIDGLSVEYAIPFPLTYMFGPDANTNYSKIFGFLLQIRRSKSALDRILIRRLTSGVPDVRMPHLKTFYALRNRLSWFVNTFMNFIMTNVIHTGLIEFHEALQKATSLDEMIFVHQSHIDRLLGRCLLRENTSALHRAILSILDLSLHFCDCLSAFAGDTSLDVSRRSLLVMRRRYRREGHYGRVNKPDVIGFVEALHASEDDTESDQDDQDEAVEPSISVGGASISFAEESLFSRLEKMNTELDGLVRFVRRGVESLAGALSEGQREAAATFGVLAFSLEDWNL